MLLPFHLLSTGFADAIPGEIEIVAPSHFRGRVIPRNHLYPSDPLHDIPAKPLVCEDFIPDISRNRKDF
jgi:hypothetical protein